MSSLTSIFNFLYVYLRCFVCYLTGTTFKSTAFDNPFQEYIAEKIIFTASNGNWVTQLPFEGEPILLLFVGIFACGSIIGLVRRLVR